MIKIRNIEKAYGNKQILKDINLDFEIGKIYGVIGPNGAGKTTLIDILSNNLEADKGHVLIKDKNNKDYSLLELAREIAYMPQNTTTKFAFTAYELVSMGNYSRSKFEGKKDEEKIHHYMKLNQLEDSYDKKVTEMSGGELQRVMFTKVLCQDSKILIIDEGTSNADIYYRVKFFETLQDEAKNGKTIIVVIHDLSFARKYCDELVILKDSIVYDFGKSSEVLNRETLRDVFKIKGDFYKNSLILE